MTNITKHDIWCMTLILITIILCLTILYIQSHSWIIRFEMDNNTLEAVKSINWSALPK